MNSATIMQIRRYADLAFRSCRQRIDDDYEQELKDALSKLGSRGISNNSSARQLEELRLKAEKIVKLIQAKTETLLEAYESHHVPIDELGIMREVNSLSIQSIAGASSSFQGEATMRAVRTSQHDPALGAKTRSFQQNMQRKSHAALIEAEHLVKKRKLAQSQPTIFPTQVHNEYHLHGVNSRVNIQSNDKSINAVYMQPDEIFTNLRTQLTSAVPDPAEKTEILQRLSALEDAQGTPAFTERLGTFLAVAANWTTIMTPFLPALFEIAHRAIPQ